MASRNTQANACIALILQNIGKNDSGNVTKLLSRLPIKRMQLDLNNKILLTFLETSRKHNNQTICKIIVNYWKENNDEEGRNPTIISIITMGTITEDLAIFVIKSFIPDVSYFLLLNQLMDQDASPEVFTACNFLEKVFGEQDSQFYKSILEILMNQELELGVANDSVKKFTIERYHKVSKFAPIPTWVRNFSDKPLVTDEELLARLPAQEELTVVIPTPEEAAVLLTTGLTQMGIPQENIDETIEHIRAIYANAPLEEKLKMLKPVYQTQFGLSLDRDQDLFRILGPLNVMLSADLTTGEVCSKYGGCRMFTCLEFENWDEETDTIINEDNYDGVEWFTGYCEFEGCGLQIRERHHAVRTPMPHGGWWGCYCSWEHVLLNMEQKNIIIRSLVTQTKAKMDQIGIQDRIAAEEIEEFSGEEDIENVNEND